MNRVCVFLSACCFLAVSGANAEEQLDCVPFEEALDIATKVNPRVEGANAERDLATANLLAAKSQSRPQVLFFAQAGQGDGRLQNNQRDNQVGLQLQQTLYNFGANRLTQAGAREQITAAGYNIEQTKGEAAQEMGTAYLEVLRSAEIQKLTVEQEQYYLQDAETADQRLTAQAITITDASQIKASAAVSASQRIDATLFKDQAQSRFAILLDLDLEYACPAPMSVVVFATETEEILGAETLDSLLSLATRNAAAVKASQSRIRAARATVEQNRRAGLPTVSFQAFVANEEDINTFTGSPTGSRITRDRVGINVSSQIYSGGLGKARIDDAQARVRGANSDLAAIRASLEDSITRSWVRIQAQQNTLEALAEARRNYKIQLDNVQAEYRIGTRTLAEVVQVAERYYSTASDEINTRYQYYNNLFVLRATVFGLM